MDYRSDKGFMKAVEENDVFAIKSELEGLIPLFKGEKIKCDQAIEYARKNSSFDWENDDGVFFGEGLKTTRQNYIYEKGRLVQNFTEDRYLKVLSLYREYKREENLNEEKKDNENLNTKKEEENIKIRKKEENNSKIQNDATKSETTQKVGVNRKKGLDKEDKTIFQRTIILGVVVVVIIWALIKIIF